MTSQIHTIIDAPCRYVHLAWAKWEREQGNLQLCIALHQRGLELNPTDAALYQVRACVRACGCACVRACVCVCVCACVCCV